MAIIEATSENFDELVNSAEYVMVDFYGDQDRKSTRLNSSH